VLIVATYRSDELHRAHPLRPLLAELDRIGWVTRMDLDRLTRQDTGRLAALIIGRKPDDDLLAAVYGRSQGNPLFIEALCGDSEPGAGLPESLRDLLVAAIAANPALVPPGRAPGEQSWHWYAAHDTARALTSAWHAAGQARRALAYAEQLAMVARVLELWEQVPDAAQRIGADHTAALEAAARAATRSCS
jgi:hypothetical protein